MSPHHGSDARRTSALALSPCCALIALRRLDVTCTLPLSICQALVPITTLRRQLTLLFPFTPDLSPTTPQLRPCPLLSNKHRQRPRHSSSRDLKTALPWLRGVHCARGAGRPPTKPARTRSTGKASDACTMHSRCTAMQMTSKVSRHRLQLQTLSTSCHTSAVVDALTLFGLVCLVCSLSPVEAVLGRWSEGECKAVVPVRTMRTCTTPPTTRTTSPAFDC